MLIFIHEYVTSFIAVLILNTFGNNIHVYRWIKIVDEKFSTKQNNKNRINESIEWFIKLLYYIN